MAAQGSRGTCPLLPSLAEATHLHLLLVLLGAAAPHLLHQPREQVVCAEGAAGDLVAALRAGRDVGAAIPVCLDAALAEVVHAVQHDGLAEELAADGTGQLLPQAPVLAPAGHPCGHTGPTLSFLPPPHANPHPSGLGRTSASPALRGRVWLPDLGREAQDLPRCCTGCMHRWKSPHYGAAPAEGHSLCRVKTFNLPSLQQNCSVRLIGPSLVSPGATRPEGCQHPPTSRAAPGPTQHRCCRVRYSFGSKVRTARSPGRSPGPPSSRGPHRATPLSLVWSSHTQPSPVPRLSHLRPSELRTPATLRPAPPAD